MLKEEWVEEVQYCGDTVEKSCINLMFGSTVAEKFLSAAVAASTAAAAIQSNTANILHY